MNARMVSRACTARPAAGTSWGRTSLTDTSGDHRKTLGVEELTDYPPNASSSRCSPTARSCARFSSTWVCLLRHRPSLQHARRPSSSSSGSRRSTALPYRPRWCWPGPSSTGAANLTSSDILPASGNVAPQKGPYTSPGPTSRRGLPHRRSPCRTGAVQEVMRLDRLSLSGV